MDLSLGMGLGGPGHNGGGGFIFANAEAAAAVARMVTAPSTEHKQIIDLFFTRLKVGAVNGTDNLTGADSCVLPMKAGIGDQWVNLIADARHPAVREGAPTFHPEYGGYSTDGVDDKIGTGTNPFSGGINFVRDSACFGVLSFKHWAFNGSTAGFFATNGVTMQFRGNTDLTTHRMNQNATDGPAGAQTTGYGFLLSNRSAAGAIQLDREGVQIDTGTNASTAIVNGELLLGGVALATSFGPGHFGGFWISNSRSANQRADLAAAFIEYYQAFLCLPVLAAPPVSALADMLAVPKAGSYTLSASRSSLGDTWSATTNGNWIGNALGADGRVWGCPFDAQVILVVDPITREARRSAFGATLSADVKKWHTFIPYREYLYGIPWNAQDVLKVNTKTRTATNITPSGGVDFSGTDKWGTGCFDPVSGLILGAPNRLGTILQLDPRDDSAVANDMGAGLAPAASEQYAGLYPVADGRVIGMPYHATGGILSIHGDELSANITEFSASDGSTLTGASKWAGGVYSARTNKIVGAPHVANDILIIDLTTNTWKRVTLGINFGAEPSSAWASGFEGPDGLLYFPPHDSTSGWLVVDPEAETASIQAFGASYTGATKWDGVTLTPSGMAVCSPSKATDILLLEGFTPNFAAATLHSGYNNNF
jgi:hypothetical protein